MIEVTKDYDSMAKCYGCNREKLCPYSIRFNYNPTQQIGYYTYIKLCQKCVVEMQDKLFPPEKEIII